VGVLVGVEVLGPKGFGVSVAVVTLPGRNTTLPASPGVVDGLPPGIVGGVMEGSRVGATPTTGLTPALAVPAVGCGEAVAVDGAPAAWLLL
jgi:hypothetical protein